MMMDAPRRDKLFLLCAGLFICAGLWLAAYGALVPYSYWWDELYSVVAASSSWDFMFSDFILRDVHPPLYQIALKLWIGLFSNAEIATRVLSLLFSYAAVFVLFSWGRKNLPKLAWFSMVLFFATNRMFIYYAQEARSYAMMLLGAAVLTVLFAKIAGNEEKGSRLLVQTSVAAFLLSLTHYFGLLYAGVILGYLFLRYLGRRAVRKSIITVLTVLACVLWPVCHYVCGHIGHSVQQGTWIQSQGWYTTLKNAAMAVFPHIYAGMYTLFASTSQSAVAVLFIIVLLITVGLAIFRRPGSAGKTQGSEELSKTARALAIILAVYLVVIVSCDLLSPMSTARNFIILLPIVSVLIGMAVQRMRGAYRIIACLFVCLFALLSIVKFVCPFVSVRGRLPAENHKAASRYIAGALAEKPYHLYYFARQGTLANIQHKMALYYFSRLPAHRGIEAQAVTMETLQSMARPFLLFVQHGGAYYDDITRTLAQAGIAYGIYLPQQRSERNVYIVRVEEAAPGG